MRSAGGCPGGFPACDHGAGKQNLVIVNLSLGERVMGDRREAEGLSRRKRSVLEHAGLETQRSKIVLIEAGVAAEDDRRQELLQRLQLLGVDCLFRVLRFLEPEIIPKTAPNRFVERELQHLVGGGLERNAAEIRIRG